MRTRLKILGWGLLVPITIILFPISLTVWVINGFDVIFYIFEKMDELKTCKLLDMKTQTGYIYPEGISAERKPELKDFYIDKIYSSIRFDTIAHNTAMFNWEKTPIPAVNAHVSQHPIEGHDEITILKPVFEIVTPGTKVEHNKGEITKIL